MMSFKILFFIGFGGFFGAILRYVITQISNKFLPVGFGTFLVNVIGSFLIGFIMSYISKFSLDENLRLFIITGFLGALTTFSTFAYENIIFLQEGKVTTFFINILANTIFSIAACFLGFIIFK